MEIGQGDVESIEVHSAGAVPPAPSTTRPMSNLNTSSHLMAMLLVDGALSFDSIHAQDRMQEPVIFALRRRIVLVESEELAQAKPRRQAIVAVKTARWPRPVQARARGFAEPPTIR